MPVKTKKNTLINKEEVDDIKSKTWLWTPYDADENPLNDKTDEELMGIIGGYKDEEDLPFVSGSDADSENDIPEWSGASYTPFDARTKWGKCIHPILSQGSCGSCWAFASTEVLSDRLCIASGGKVDVVLSPQFMVSCDKSKSKGCGGGYPYDAFKYMSTTGAPLNSCVPYKGTNGICPSKCTTATVPFSKYYCKSGSAMKLSGVTNIMNQIQKDGPVVSVYNLYSDFYNYKSGIYTHVSGKSLGGHVVKVIGWGSTNGVNYWIAANSWGTSWGEKGFFRIKFGEVSFDDTMYACQARV